MGTCGMGGRLVGGSEVVAGMAAAVALSLCLLARHCPQSLCLESMSLASSMPSLPLQALGTNAFIAAAVSAGLEAASASPKAGPAPLTTPSHPSHTPLMPLSQQLPPSPSLSPPPPGIFRRSRPQHQRLPPALKDHHLHCSILLLTAKATDLGRLTVTGNNRHFSNCIAK